MTLLREQLEEINRRISNNEHVSLAFDPGWLAEHQQEPVVDWTQLNPPQNERIRLERGGGVITRSTSLFYERNGMEPVRTPEQMREEMEQLSQAGDPERILDHLAISMDRAIQKPKVKPIDRLYPHHCQNKKCARQLKFEELLFAEANRKLKSSFIDQVFEHLSEKYSQFTYNVRADWSDVIGRFEYRQYLRKLWKNPRVQFYCCACFRKATLTDVHDAPEYNGESIIGSLYDEVIGEISEGTGLSREELLGEWSDGIPDVPDFYWDDDEDDDD